MEMPEKISIFTSGSVTREDGRRRAGAKKRRALALLRGCRKRAAMEYGRKMRREGYSLLEVLQKLLANEELRQAALTVSAARALSSLQYVHREFSGEFPRESSYPWVRDARETKGGMRVVPVRASSMLACVQLKKFQRNSFWPNSFWLPPYSAYCLIIYRTLHLASNNNLHTF